MKTVLHLAMQKTKKRPNGPGKGRANISTTVDLETSAEIDRLAAAGGLTRSQWARAAITDIAAEATIYGITKKIQVTSGNIAPQSRPSNLLRPSEISDGGSCAANRPSSRQAI